MHSARARQRPDELASFQLLREQAQSISGPPQQLNQITSPAPKGEDVTGKRVLGERGLHQRRQTMHAAAHIRHAGSEPHLGAARRADHTRCARQSSTTPSTCESTAPRTRIVAPMKVISINASEFTGGRAGAGRVVFTGSSAAALLSRALSPATVCVVEYCTIQRRSRFALIPWASAIPDTETPGRSHSCTKARLAATLYVRRPLVAGLRIRPSTSSALFSGMVSTTQMN